jgi:hypothetical protein
MPPRTPEGKEADIEKRPRSRRLRNALILVFLCAVLVSAYVFSGNWFSSSQQAEEGGNVNVPRAAILDGLYNKSPNSTLTETMSQYLSNSGYTVDVYKGTNVTIDLLRNIGGYKVLILRLHSGVTTDGRLYIYSGEKYTQDKYVFDQLTEDVKRGNTFDKNETPYFALKSTFFGQSAHDGLNGTTLILMGCNGSANEFIIQDFFQKGIKAYISWDGYVDLPHSDEATLRLVKAMYLEGLSPDVAVEKVNKEVGPDPFYKTKLTCFLP